MSSHSNKGTLAGLAALLGAMFAWGMSPIFIRFFKNYMDAWSQNFIRYSFAMLFLLPLLLIRVKKGQVSRTQWRNALVPACFNTAMQCCWAWSLYYLSPGFTVLLARMSMIFVFLFSFMVFPAERKLFKNPWFWCGLTFTVTGVLGVIVFAENFEIRGDLVGVLLVMGSTSCWAAYTVSARYFFQDVDSRISFAMVALYTVPLLAVLAFTLGEPAAILDLKPSVWGLVILSGVISIATAHMLFYRSIKRLGVNIPAVVLSLSPFLVNFLSFICFGEMLTSGQWLCGIVLIAGTVTCTLSKNYKAKTD